MEKYGAEEKQGTEGPFEFYFQTHGAEPGELKEELDEMCGEGKYALKMIDLDRWILRSSRPLSPDEQSRIKRVGSDPDDDDSKTTPTPPPPQQLPPVRTESTVSHPGPMARTDTWAAQRLRRLQTFSLATTMVNFMNRLRKGKEEPSRTQDSIVPSPPPPNITA